MPQYNEQIRFKYISRILFLPLYKWIDSRKKRDAYRAYKAIYEYNDETTTNLHNSLIEPRVMEHIRRKREIGNILVNL